MAKRGSIKLSEELNNMLNERRLPFRIAAGTRAKLDFDFSCNRGHSFGEYHVHGVVNEILCSNLDPVRYRVDSGFAHPRLQSSASGGRKREVDFAVSLHSKDEGAANGNGQFYAEVKWAGSSHCSQENVLQDLCRLQIIKNVESSAQCIFVLAGKSTDISKLFSSGIFMEGSECLLHRQNGLNAITERGRNSRMKKFFLNDNASHDIQLTNIKKRLSVKLPCIPDLIYTRLIRSKQSAPHDDRFQVLVWSVESYSNS